LYIMLSLSPLEGIMTGLYMDLNLIHELQQ
jgi:hypothetical protein